MKRMSQAEAESISIEALAFLGGDSDRFARFLALSGIELASLRDAAAESGFLASILDYFCADESLLLAFAENAARAPQTISEAREALGSQTPGHST